MTVREKFGKVGRQRKRKKDLQCLIRFDILGTAEDKNLEASGLFDGC